MIYSNSKTYSPRYATPAEKADRWLYAILGPAAYAEHREAQVKKYRDLLRATR